MRKKETHSSKASVDAFGAEFLRCGLIAGKAQIGRKCLISSMSIAGVRDILVGNRFRPPCWFSDIWMSLFEPSARSKKSVTHTTYGFFVLPRGLLKKAQIQANQVAS